ncbi:hypothetical protein D3C73_811160 [compost metagenome]
MPKYAALSEEATEWLRRQTGSPHLECYTYIDPDESTASFFVVKTTNKVIHVSFSEISYQPSSYESLLQGLYKTIYE